MKLTLGFSPCPNDTFIFDALVNNKMDTGDLSFDVRLEDVETLNRLALNNALDISKISYGVLPLVMDTYIVLNSGSALGTGVGPLLVCKQPIGKDEIKDCRIAIPGEHTTAHMLFSLAFPEARNKVFLRYDEIEAFVLHEKETVAGVIIHENRFTYQEKGLVKLIDLGEYWEQETQSPIPLGGIVAKRSIDPFLLKRIDELIKQSIEYSFTHYPEITEYVRAHSQEMEEAVMRKHIDLYVNDYSLNLGEKGKNAIMKMMGVHEKPGALSFMHDSLFLT
jgi:1,4-dihydroxy-6-naphthoate synthase